MKNYWEAGEALFEDHDLGEFEPSIRPSTFILRERVDFGTPSKDPHVNVDLCRPDDPFRMQKVHIKTRGDLTHNQMPGFNGFQVGGSKFESLLPDYGTSSLGTLPSVKFHPPEPKPDLSLEMLASPKPVVDGLAGMLRSQFSSRGCEDQSLSRDGNAGMAFTPRLAHETVVKLDYNRCGCGTTPQRLEPRPGPGAAIASASPMYQMAMESYRNIR